MYPKAIPYTGAYVKVVKATGKAPSGNDPVLMKFFANTSVITSDQLVSIVVFDAVLKPNTKAAPYDSANGVATFVIPDAPDPNNAIVLVGGASWQPYKTPGTPSWTIVRTIDGQDKTLTKVKKEKQFETEVIPTENDVTYKGTIKVGTTVTYDIPPFTFRPEKGAIYEVLVVGKINDPNGNVPRFIVIRTNPTI